MTKLAASQFAVNRHTAHSEFSHFTGTWDQLVLRTLQNWDKQKPGYRDGVILVPVEPDGLFTNICQLKEGAQLVGEYKARRPGEEPRKSTGVVGGKKMPAQSCDIVCYRADVLDEDGDRSTDADWEIISVNASPFTADVEVPIPTGALIANHLHLDGGTETHMTDEEFVAALRKSVEFWKDKSHPVTTPGTGPWLAIMVEHPEAVSSIGEVAATLESPHVKCFGNDEEFARGYADHMKTMFDETWIVVQASLPGSDLPLDPSAG